MATCALCDGDKEVDYHSWAAFLNVDPEQPREMVTHKECPLCQYSEDYRAALREASRLWTEWSTARLEAFKILMKDRGAEIAER